jgi:hypothetical protein
LPKNIPPTLLSGLSQFHKQIRQFSISNYYFTSESKFAEQKTNKRKIQKGNLIENSFNGRKQHSSQQLRGVSKNSRITANRFEPLTRPDLFMEVFFLSTSVSQSFHKIKKIEVGQIVLS